MSSGRMWVPGPDISEFMFTAVIARPVQTNTGLGWPSGPSAARTSSLHLGSRLPDRVLALAGRASSGSGCAAVWLDAVLAEQVAQALELGAQALVLPEYGFAGRADRQLVLQLRPVGEALLFPAPPC